MSKKDHTQVKLYFEECIPALQEYLFVLESLEEKLYNLLDDHPEEMLLHVSLALVAVSIELLSHLIELLQSTIKPELL